MKTESELKKTLKDTEDKLKQQLAIITDFDLLFSENEKDEILRILQIKFGKTKKELLKIIKSL
jgi:hypothetical protein